MNKFNKDILESLIPFVEFIIKQKEINYYFGVYGSNNIQEVNCYVVDDSCLHICYGHKLNNIININHISAIIKDLSRDFNYDLYNVSVQDLVSTLDKLLKMKAFI